MGNSYILIFGNVVWALVKPLLDEVTVNKINFLGYNYKEKLLESITPQNLPKFLGGTCTCPGGCELADVGPWNDGSVPGFPIEDMERFEVLYGASKKFDRWVTKKD